jgi:Holliday junction resolvase
MRLRGKVDLNQREIVEALRKAGGKVAITSNLGGGFPDLLCKFRGTLYLLEVKSKGGRLTQEERDFFDDWQEVTTVVYTIEDALKAVGVI